MQLQTFVCVLGGLLVLSCTLQTAVAQSNPGKMKSMAEVLQILQNLDKYYSQAARPSKCNCGKHDNMTNAFQCLFPVPPCSRRRNKNNCLKKVVHTRTCLKYKKPSTKSAYASWTEIIYNERGRDSARGLTQLWGNIYLMVKKFQLEKFNLGSVLFGEILNGDFGPLVFCYLSFINDCRK